MGSEPPTFQLLDSNVDQLFTSNWFHMKHKTFNTMFHLKQQYQILCWISRFTLRGRKTLNRNKTGLFQMSVNCKEGKTKHSDCGSNSKKMSNECETLLTLHNTPPFKMMSMNLYYLPLMELVCCPPQVLLSGLIGVVSWKRPLSLVVSHLVVSITPLIAQT